MTAERRLAKLEGALSPKAATLLWLAEAHQFGSLPAYVDWLIDQPASAAPLYRVPKAAEAGVRAAQRAEKHDVVERSVREAVRQAVFLVELVIRLNTAAEETIRLLGLRYVALYWEMRATTVEAQLARAGVADHWRAWRRAGADLLTDLYAAEEARGRLESHYLDGHPALFPDAVADWQMLREAAERLAGLGDMCAVAPNAGRRRRKQPALDLDALRTAARDRAPTEAADLADTARATTLELLGDTEGAAPIAERRLRSQAAGIERPGGAGRAVTVARMK